MQSVPNRKFKIINAKTETFGNHLSNGRIDDSERFSEPGVPMTIVPLKGLMFIQPLLLLFCNGTNMEY
jgi:hypothetical protein